MKYIHSVAAAAMLSLMAPVALQAQTLRMGLEAGWQHSMPSGQNSGNGLYAGATVAIDFSKEGSGWFADAAMMFDKKQWESSGYLYYPYPGQGIKDVADTWHYTTYGLKIPVTAGYKWHLSRAVQLYAAAGPYLSLGIAGKERLVAVGSDGTVKDDKLSGNVYKDGVMHRAAWGIGGKVGIDVLGHYRLTVSYDHGMSDIFKKEYIEAKHRTLCVGIGYRF